MEFKLFDVEGRGVKLVGYHYEVENPKVVVVLIHGIGEHAGRYARMADYFKAAGIAIVSMDLRGHGRSEGKRGDCAPREEVLKDIDILIETAQKMYPGVPIVMYGHSMGGGLTCDYKARGGHNDIPVGYVISAPWLKLVKSFPKPVISVLSGLAKLLPKVQISSDCNEEDLGNLEFVRPYKDDELVHPKVTMQCAIDGFVLGEKIASGKNIDNGRAHKTPTLLMHGSADKICDVNGSREYAKLQFNLDNPKFEFIEWPGYYHEIHNGGPNGETGEEPIKKAVEFITSLG